MIALSGTFLIANNWLMKAVGPTVLVAALSAVLVLRGERTRAGHAPPRPPIASISRFVPAGPLAAFAVFLAINCVGLFGLPWAIAVAAETTVSIDTTAWISTCGYGGWRGSVRYDSCIRIARFVGWLPIKNDNEAWLTSVPQSVHIIGLGSKYGVFVQSLQP
ncbi:MAG: hypothetical protein U1E48_01050 [Paracoccaceae bacterium]